MFRNRFYSSMSLAWMLIASAPIALAIPPMEGESELIGVVNAARQDLIKQLKAGVMTATCEDSKNWKWALDIFWDHDKIHCRCVETPWDHLEKKPMMPVVTRILFDGKVYANYMPDVSGGIMTIESPSQARLHDWYFTMAIQPSELFAVNYPNGRRWEELLGYHRNFPSDEVLKWTCRRMNDDRVEVCRHDQGGGLYTAVMSLSNGLAISERYRSKRQNLDTRYTHTTNPQGVTYYSKIQYDMSFELLNKKITKTLEIKSLERRERIDPRMFTIDSLQLINGATIKDFLNKREYTHGGKVIDQRSMDEQAAKLKAQRKSSSRD